MSTKAAAFAVAETSRRRVNSSRLLIELVSLNRNNQHSLNGLYNASRCSTLSGCIGSIQKQGGRENNLKLLNIGFVTNNDLLTMIFFVFFHFQSLILHTLINS